MRYRSKVDTYILDMHQNNSFILSALEYLVMIFCTDRIKTYSSKTFHNFCLVVKELCL